MKRGRWAACILGLVTGLAGARAPAAASPFPPLFGKKAEHNEQMQAAALVPLPQIAPAYRDKVSQVLARPTIYSRGPVETFESRPEMYRWLLDNPDRAVVAWKRLGAKCLDIERRGENTFGWGDAQGSDVVWTAIHAGPDLRVWYAEGQVKPGNLFPMVPVQCVVVIRHGILGQEKGEPLMQHQADIFAYTDSKTATLVTRMLGPSVPRLAKQGISQLQMFFGALAWYCHQHPDRVEALLRPQTPLGVPAKRQPSPFDPAGMIVPQSFSGPAPVPYE